MSHGRGKNGLQLAFPCGIKARRGIGLEHTSREICSCGYVTCLCGYVTLKILHSLQSITPAGHVKRALADVKQTGQLAWELHFIPIGCNGTVKLAATDGRGEYAFFLSHWEYYSKGEVSCYVQ